MMLTYSPASDHGTGLTGGLLPNEDADFNAHRLAKQVSFSVFPSGGDVRPARCRYLPDITPC